MVLAVSALVIAFATLDGRAYAQLLPELVCYQWSIFPHERLRLNISSPSPLTTLKERVQFQHPKQLVYEVSGKEVGGCGTGSMAPVVGTIIVAKSQNAAIPTGAHMGLHGFFVRGEAGPPPFETCWPIQWNCTTSEASEIPDTWNCTSRNDAPLFHGASTLTKVDPKTDPLCSVFQDGAPGGAAERSQTPGSAMKP